MFLEDEKRRYGYLSHSVPHLCTSDCPWPIIKSLLSCFNRESLENYICPSYKIASGEATAYGLPSKCNKTFVHILLCHLMKAICFRINKTVKHDKSFLKYTISLLANSGNLKHILMICRALFFFLLSKSDETPSFKEHKKFIKNCSEAIEQFKNDALTKSDPCQERLSD